MKISEQRADDLHILCPGGESCSCRWNSSTNSCDIPAALSASRMVQMRRRWIASHRTAWSPHTREWFWEQQCCSEGTTPHKEQTSCSVSRRSSATWVDFERSEWPYPWWTSWRKYMTPAGHCRLNYWTTSIGLTPMPQTAIENELIFCLTKSSLCLNVKAHLRRKNESTARGACTIICV